MSDTDTIPGEIIDAEDPLEAGPWTPPTQPGWLHGPDLTGIPRCADDWREAGRWAGRTILAALWVAAVHVWRVIYRSPIGVGRALRGWWRWVRCHREKDALPQLLHAAKAAVSPVQQRAARDRYSKAVGVAKDAPRTRARVTIVVLVFAAAGWLVAVTVWPLTRPVTALAAVVALGVIGRHRDPRAVPGAQAIAGVRADMPQLMAALHAAKLCKSPDGLDVRVVREWTRERGGRTVTVDLPGTATAAASKAGIIAARLGAGEDMLVVDTDRTHAGRLTVRQLDRAPFDPGMRVPKAPLLRAGDVSSWAPVPVGYDPWGRPVTIDLAAEEPGGVVGGKAGAGKSVAGTGFLGWAALDPTCRLWLTDGGADTRPWRPIAERCIGADHDAVVAMLQDLQTEMDRRISLLPTLRRPDGSGIGVTKLTREVVAANPGKGLDMILVWVDEAGLYTTGPRKADVVQLMQDLSGRLRKAGGRVFLATTELDAETLPRVITRNLGWRLALRCASSTASRMVTGLEASDGWDASRIDPAKPGVAYLIGPSERRTLRSWEYTPAEVDQIAAEALRRREAAGTIPTQPNPVGSIPQPRSGADPTQPTTEGSDPILVSRVREILGHHDRMHSARIAAELADRWPDDYTGWDAKRFGEEWSAVGQTTERFRLQGAQGMGVIRRGLQ